MALNFNTSAYTYGSTSSEKILVAYFSHSRNTKIVAEQISRATRVDMFGIEPADSYPSEYNILVGLAKKDVENNYSPPLKEKIGNIASYDIIFIGSPNWWGTIAPPVETFLTGCDLSGKIIIPFMTLEGSGMGGSVGNIRKLCPGSDVLEGYPVRGSHAIQAQYKIRPWLKSINITE